MVSNRDIANRIKRLRLRRGWTQEEVAKRIPTARPNYARWEKGETNFSVTDVQLLAKAFEVKTSYFFEEDQDWAPQGEEKWDGDDVVGDWYRGVPPGPQRDMVREMLRAAYEASERERTTHGRKAE